MTASPGGRRDAPPTGRNIDRRSAARLAAVQALYQIELAGGSTTEVVEQFLRHHLREREEDAAFGKPDTALFAAIVRGVAERAEDIDRMLASTLTESWTVERLEVVLRCILRAGAYELLARPGVPARAAINEYVELAHAFYAGAEPGMVNGLLDRLARLLRPEEFASPDPDG
jgi:N utilization substance protein B